MTQPAAGAPFFFFNDTATTEIYTLSLHDALPISRQQDVVVAALALVLALAAPASAQQPADQRRVDSRSEEHTSELQSPCNLVCRLLLEKKNTKSPPFNSPTMTRTNCSHTATTVAY